MDPKAYLPRVLEAEYLAAHDGLTDKARALLRDAPVVVLEDADADLMPAERDAVQRALGALTAGRTALISSREPETILDADRVLCFEAGALAEDGAPAELADDPDSWLAVWLRSTAETAG